MLKAMSQCLYIYVVARDFGFAPNPYHGHCTLATCAPRIRASAQIGDWIMGVGGRRLKATGKVIYLMKVAEIISFNSYWIDPRFYRKKPLRNGSSVMMVGDNIYHQETDGGPWIQADSHHSNLNGSTNKLNLETDTSSNNVLISDYFYYFGKSAPKVDLASLGYKNRRGYKKMPLSDENVSGLIQELELDYKKEINLVMNDPFDFWAASKRVDQATGKII